MKQLKSLLIVAAAALGATALPQVEVVVQVDQLWMAPDVARRAGVTLKDTAWPLPFALMEARNLDDADRAAALLERDRRVRQVEFELPDFEASQGQAARGSTIASVGGRDALVARNSRALQQVGFDARAATASGRRVRIAILDTGLSPRQKRLWARVAAAANFVEPDRPAWDLPGRYETNGDGRIDGAVGHGTMIAALIDQVAPRCELLVARVADSDGVASAWSVAKGLAFAVEHDAEVVNLSLGARRMLITLDIIIRYLEQRGIIVVTAAGNNGREGLLFPAKSQDTISVGGLNANNTRAHFSNWGEGLVVSAPAVGLTTQWWTGQSAVWSGTSFATPLVAGAVGDALRKTRRMDAGTVRDVLHQSGDSIDTLNPDHQGQLGVRLNIGRFQRFLQWYDRNRQP